MEIKAEYRYLISTRFPWLLICADKEKADLARVVMVPLDERLSLPEYFTYNDGIWLEDVWKVILYIDEL